MTIKLSQQFLDHMEQVRKAEERYAEMIKDVPSDKAIHDEFIYEQKGLPDSDYRSKLEAFGKELHEELAERLRCGRSQTEVYASCPRVKIPHGKVPNLPSFEPRVVRGVSPRHRYPQLQQIPRGIPTEHVMRFQTVAYEVAEAKITANLPDGMDELLTKWREAFRRVAQRGYLILEEGNQRTPLPLNFTDLETYLTDNQQEPVKQKPYWMQLQDNQQKRQRGSRGKTKRSK